MKSSYFTSLLGMLLAVDFIGGHIGSQWPDIFLNSFNNQASLSPAV